LQHQFLLAKECHIGFIKIILSPYSLNTSEAFGGGPLPTAAWVKIFYAQVQTKIVSRLPGI
jgi:hypothetical protein